MATGSKIEWVRNPDGTPGATWNPVSGCARVSAGCDHCYAAAMTHRLASMPKTFKRYGRLTAVNGKGERHFNGTVRCHEDVLPVPLHWKKPRMVFVNSMGDLFHPKVPFDFIDQVFAVMNVTHAHVPLPPKKPSPWHVYQVLTKRPEVAVEYYVSRDTKLFKSPGEHPVIRAGRELMRGKGTNLMNAAACLMWAPSNVWLGTSVENQETADERIPHLLRCPAALRFLSLEPLLGEVILPVTQRSESWPNDPNAEPLALSEDYPSRFNNVVKTAKAIADPDRLWHGSVLPPGGMIHWVIVGGESGPGARPMHPDWVRSIRDQCQSAGVPFFFKQWGEWVPGNQATASTAKLFETCRADRFFETWDKRHGVRVGCCRVGKKAAGRLLDGRTWDEMPGQTVESRRK